MRVLTLKQAAERLSLTRPNLIKRMRAADLLDEHNLPRHPVRDQQHLTVREGNWTHPELGMQYSRSTRVRPGSLIWLAGILNIEPPHPPEKERADVA